MMSEQPKPTGEHSGKDDTWSGDSDWSGKTPEPISPQPTKEFLEKMQPKPTGEWTKWQDSLLSLRLPDGSRIECSSTEARDKVIAVHNAAIKEAYEKGMNDQYEKLRLAGCLNIHAG